MPASPNTLKQALAEDRLQTGIWLGLRSPQVAEIAATAGFDWCLLDGEHGPYDISALATQIALIQGAGGHPVVRVPVGAAWMIKQVLDLGTQSVLVPMVDTAAQAEKMVRAMRYPPEGIRGMAAPVIRASGFNAQTDYAATANAQMCLIVQAESVTALENIDAIAATDGVDCVFIGPADLSVDMGHGGELGAPELDEAIEHMISGIIAAGKSAGILVLDPARAERYARLGVRFLGVASDVFSFSKAVREMGRWASTLKD